MTFFAFTPIAIEALLLFSQARDTVGEWFTICFKFALQRCFAVGWLCDINRGGAALRVRGGALAALVNLTKMASPVKGIFCFYAGFAILYIDTGASLLPGSALIGA